MSSHPLHRLTAEQVHEFHLNGFLVVEDLLTAQETNALSDHVDRIASGKLPHRQRELLLDTRLLRVQRRDHRVSQRRLARLAAL